MSTAFRVRAGICCLLTPAILLSTGCDDDPAGPDEDDLSAAMEGALATFHGATAPYLDPDAAIADGFVQMPVCEDPPGPGAIGIPFVNASRLDINIDVAEPAILFYEPQQNGELILVGGEPVAPIQAWDASESAPPSLFGRESHRNEEHGLYGLHMWVWRYNPEGVLAFGNPNVSCAFAEAAGA